VSVPPNAGGPRPLLVATHGAGGRARTHCALWRRIVGRRAFVLCPRGSPLDRRAPPADRGYFYDGHPALAREITLAVEALRARFGAAVDVRRPVYGGYSQGATMGSLMLPQHPAAFAAAVLMEGGFGQSQEWNIASARRFYRNGGRRVLLVCGRPVCREVGRVTAGYLRRGGLQVQLIEAPGAGHHYDGALHALVAAHFDWVVADDPRW